MDPESSPERGLGEGYKYLATGLRFGGAIVMFVLGGLWLDGRLHTRPLFIIVGTLLGAGLGFLSVWREIQADPEVRSTHFRKKPRGP